MFVIVFIYEILIYMCSKEDNIGQLRSNLQILKDSELFIELSKCDFLLNLVMFLGHIVHNGGILVDSQ